MLGVVAWLSSVSYAAQPPNVIMMVVDDLGWNDVGWRDSFKQIKTPKLDAMVREEGALLTNYYVYRFCSPTRSTFMSGRYPWHIGQQTRMNLNPMPGIACGINLKYDFLPKVLKQKGYATWALGKVRIELVFCLHLRERTCPCSSSCINAFSSTITA